jgi:hypothetical protein
MPSVSLLENAYANTRAKLAAEQTELYTRVWSSTKGYGSSSDFVARTLPRIREAIETFYPIRSDSPRPTIIDFGAGNGIYLASLLGAGAVSAPSVGVDLVKPAAVPAGIEWLTQPMWEPLGRTAGFAISLDALEHLPPVMVPDALQVIRASAPHGFVRISTRKDNLGAKFGAPLHLTVQSPELWVHQFVKYGFPLTHYSVEVGNAIELRY